jgi:hypothetical protein
MWDGDILAGPVPTLFAEDADLSSEALAGDPAKAHGDLAKLYRAFFMPEHLQLADAVELLRKPRAGAALFSFRRGKYSVPEAPTSPAPKRRRPDEDEETGNPSFFVFPLSPKHQHCTVLWFPFSLAKVHLPRPPYLGLEVGQSTRKYSAWGNKHSSSLLASCPESAS